MPVMNKIDKIVTNGVIMKQFWEDRYKEDFFIYGKEPNRFFAEQIDEHSPGRLLLPMEGEGRNAVYAAKKGWQVDAIDFSEAAQDKALKLAAQSGVAISYHLRDMTSPELHEGVYDAAAMIYAHLPDIERKRLHQSVETSLRPGGVLILEAFHKKQIGNDSGGPSDPSMLYDASTLKSDFKESDFLTLQEIQTELYEGVGHRGSAWVIRAVLRKI